MEDAKLRKRLNWKKYSPCPWGRGKHDLSDRKLTFDEKFWLGKTIAQGKISVRKVANTYNLNRETLRKWGKVVQKWPINFLDHGRPPLLGAVAVAKLKDIVKSNCYNISKVKFEDEALKLAKETAVQRGKLEYEIENISPRTLQRLCTAADSKFGNADKTTKARQEACSDPRNAAAFAAMIGHANRTVNYHLKLNVDATQFKLGHDTKKKEVVLVPLKSGDMKRAAKAESTDDAEGITAYFIKAYILISAGGHAAAPIYVVASKEMPEGAIDVYPVSGLGLHTGTFGHVVFCQARHPLPVAFYEWFYSTPLQVFIDSIKEGENLASDDISYLQVDGEARQVEPFSNSNIIRLFEEKNIMVGNPPGSSTELTQPVDGGQMIPDINRKLEHLTDKDFLGSKVIDRIQESVIDEHIGKFKKPEQCATDIISTAHQKMLKHGLVRLATVYRDVLTTKKVVQNAFSVTGVHKYPEDKLETWETIFKSWRCSMTPEYYNHLVEKLPRLIDIIGKKGEILHEDFERLNIPGTDKDRFCASRRRAVILNHQSVLKRDAIRESGRIPSAPRKKARVITTSEPSEEVMYIPKITSSSSYFANITTATNA